MPVTPLTEDVLILAHERATNRSRAIRLRSFIGTKMHKLSKPGNIAKTSAAFVGGLLIPFGGSIGTDWVIGKIDAKRREKSHQAKMRKYHRLVKSDTEDTRALAHRVKFDIKSLDVKHLDNSMRKLSSQLEQFNKPGGPSLSKCHAAIERAYRYYRAVYRAEKLKLEAMAMIEVGEEIVKYCEQVEDALDNAYDSLESEVNGLANHDICSAGKGCFNGERGEQALHECVEKIKQSYVELP